MGGDTVAPEGAAGVSGQRAIRANNLGVVLRTVRRLAPCSRAEVAAAAGLTKSTVSSLVAELIEYGLLRESGATSVRKVGRPGLMLEVDESSVAAIGLEVNVDYLTVVALDLTGGELFSRHIDFDARSAGPAASVCRMAGLIADSLVDPLLSQRRILGVGIAVPGLIDTATGTVRNAPNLGWRDFPLGESLAASPTAPMLRGIPVLADNDVSLGVLAEHRHGHLAGTPDLVYITGEVGIGAGLLADGVLLRGAGGYSGEIGHISLLPGGPACVCGRHGCLEALAGIEAILRRAVPDLVTDGPLSGAALAQAVQATVQRAESGEDGVCDVLREAGTWLGRGAAILVNLLDPQAVILGGYFVPLAPWILPAGESELRTRMIAPAGEDDRLQPSVLGLSAAARGGAAALIQALDRGRLPFPSRVAPTASGAPDTGSTRIGSA
ncbi:ROK family transcriptional regulator [Allosalinactinospora lopnorensis]|uniref:ROK family transcriptional regulator n=1 Tax=Allosalinactinospora lopnorensis TaxID=1352348 RepID=UPI000623C519|nr:ROK family transcriptional regulator [Allosalinactinospora lopnorensis]